MKKIYFLLIGSWVTITTINTANAQAGALDLTFGSGGMVTTDFSGFGDRGNAIAIQSDGRIIVVGNNGSAGYALARYNTDGTLDNAFGTGGKVTTAIAANGGDARSVVIQPDNKIIVGGWSFVSGSGQTFAVARYNSDGTLDNTFGSGGIVTTVVGTSNDYGIAIALQNDGKIVLAGRTSNSNFNWDFAVVRYTSNGTLDNTFGTGGKATTTGAGNVDVSSVAIQADGKIIVAGSMNVSGQNDFALIRFNTNGILDNTFGSGGKVNTVIGADNDYLSSIVLQSDGKIVGAGWTLDVNTFKNNFVLVRYNTDGSLDNSLDLDGKVTTDIGAYGGNGFSAALQADGKIVVVGDAANQSLLNDFGLIRYNNDGSLDNTFDSDGKVTTAFVSNESYAKCVAIQNDGKIVVAGFRGDASNSSGNVNVFAVARYDAGAIGITENREVSDVQVYPNPAKDILSIQLSEFPINGNLKLNLFNVVGQPIKQVSIHSKETTIELDNISSGIYFYQLQNEQNILKTGKIIVE